MFNTFSNGTKALIGVSIALFLVLVVALSSFKPTTANSNLASLSEIQIQSVISLLLAFGVSPELMQNIEISLRGKVPEMLATSATTTTPVPVEDASPPSPPTVATNNISISISPTPAAKNVSDGVAYVLVGGFLFDATLSKEDISFSSLKFLYTDNALYDPYNCAIFSGPDEFMTRYKYNFNPDWVHPAGTRDYAFLLTTPLVISKGTTRVVDIRCHTNSRAFGGTGFFSWGLSGADGKATFTGTGVERKEIIIPQVVPGVGNPMTFTS